MKLHRIQLSLSSFQADSLTEQKRKRADVESALFLSERIEYSFKRIIAECKIFENPDYGVESEEEEVNNRYKLAKEERKVNNDLGYINGSKLLTLYVKNERLGIADSVFTCDIESDEEIGFIKQILGMKVKSCFSA